MKRYDKLYEGISTAKGVLSEDMFRFSDIVEIQEENECVTEKVFSDEKELGENMNDAEIDYASVENPLNIHRFPLNEATLISEIPNLINEENVIIAPGQGKNLVSILSDEFCEERTFPYLLPADINFAIMLLRRFQKVLHGTLIKCC